MAKKKQQPLTPAPLTQEDMADSTREQQEAHVRTIERRCAGPLMYPDELEQAGFKQFREFEAKGDDKGVRKMIEAALRAAQSVAGPGLLVSVPELKDLDMPALRRIVLPLIRLRGARVGKGCRADHNDLICAEEFDGAEHEVECPGCGTPVNWKAPVFH